MRIGFYSRIAWNNIRKNERLYLPNILAGMGLAAVFYIILTLSMDNRLGNVRGGHDSSEGYEDRERFFIMQKVGMSQEEVKGTIKSQKKPHLCGCCAHCLSHPMGALHGMARIYLKWTEPTEKYWVICHRISGIIRIFLFMTI